MSAAVEHPAGGVSSPRAAAPDRAGPDATRAGKVPP